MIITRLKGGMGNQMFQYAMALNVAQKLDTELRIDLSSLLDRSKGEDFVYRNYDLSIFNVNDNFVHSPSVVHLLSKLKSASVTRYFRNQVNKGRTHLKEKDFHFQQHFIDQTKDDTILEGWFQSPKYFEDIAPLIRKEFTFVKPVLEVSQDLLKKIKSTNAVCLNVRRTDFLKVDNLNTTNLEYFQEAARYIGDHVKNPTFFIFSDDVQWCLENIQLDHPTQVIGHEHKGEKFGNYMQLMIACKHYIIPNSSFAWWAVWLNANKNKKVVAPKNWFNDSAIDTSDLVPEDWVRL
ncbi:MAG: alpha-1,2-fucosyltransferase [Saprospiraceae bacterium]